MPQKYRVKQALLIGIVFIIGLMVIVTVAQAPTGTAIRSSTGADLVPEEMNWVNISPDIISNTGNMNITWNFTTWNSAKYPLCYIRVFTNYDTILMGQYQLIGPTALNKTGNVKIPFSSFPNGVYLLHLMCDSLDTPINNSVNLDIVPVVINVAPTALTRNQGIASAEQYVTCQNMPGLTDPQHCIQWQESMASGRSWNISLGAPV